MKYRLLVSCLLLLTGRIVAQQKFEGGSRFMQGYARIVDHGHSFYIDSTGKTAFDTIYNDRVLTDYRVIDSVYLPQDILVVGLKGKQGVMTVTGNWILPIDYDTIDTYSYEQWIVKKDNKVSLYTTKGFMLPFRFEDSNQLDSTWFAVKENGKWGVYNKAEDQVTVPYTYEEVDYCYGCSAKGDYVLAKKDGKWGVVSFKNEVLVPFEYDHEHMNMRSDEWIESFYKNDQKMSINLKTKEVEVDTCGCLPMEEDISSADTQLGRYTLQRRNGKWGLMNAAGKVILDPVYDDINHFSDSSDVIGILRNGKYGVADTTGKIIVPLAYDYWVEPKCGGAVLLTEKNGKDIAFDKRGKQILTQYSSFNEMTLEDGTMMLAIAQGKLKGFYNPASGKLVPPKYTTLNYYGDAHLMTIGVGDKYGYIDREGNTIVPPIYDMVDLHYVAGNDQLVIVTLKDKMGVFDMKQQKMVIPIAYDYISNYTDSSLLQVTKNGLYGLYNLSGKLLCPAKYQDIVPIDTVYLFLRGKDTAKAEVFNKHTHELTKLSWDTAFVAYEEHLILVWEGRKCFMYDVDKKQQVEGDYSQGGYPGYLGYFANHRAAIVKNKKFGYIDAKGNYVIQPKYDYMSGFHKGVAAVFEFVDTANRIFHYGYIDSTGKEIVPVIYDVPQEVVQRFSEEAFFGDENSEELVLIKNDQRGLAGLNGRIILPVNYDHISPEKNGRGYLVTQGDKFGILDPNGREILKPQYENIMLDEAEGYDGRVAFSFPIMAKESEDSWIYLDAQGKSIGMNVAAFVDFVTEDWGAPPIEDPTVVPPPPVLPAEENKEPQ
ncbi:WG repeat-containing protein [Chitinophaga sp.]|uniref:WG repeat-containing protein n=1 Tax=Chitinophaga sp. TaxID=1869181 RepID=UPI0031CEE740